MDENKSIMSLERIESRILIVRGQKVLLDRDLAILYGVKNIRLREQVKRNIERFPDDFMFQLSDAEVDFMVSQNAIPSRRSLGGHNPYVFTQEGVAMLSGVLKSRRAVSVNIQIMRAFVRMRGLLEDNAKLAAKLRELESRMDEQDKNTVVILATLRKLVAAPQPPKKMKIGFHHNALKNTKVEA